MNDKTRKLLFDVLDSGRAILHDGANPNPGIGQQPRERVLLSKQEGFGFSE